MARFSSTLEFSPTGTVLAPGTTNSNAVKTEAAKDARVFIDVEVVAAGADIDIRVQISPDNVDFATIRTFNNITATGLKTLALKQEELGTFTRLQYFVLVANITLKARLEKKQGV